MTLTKVGEKRRAKRFQIDCPVTVSVLSPRNGGGMTSGRLRNIGDRGARFQLGYPLQVGSQIILQVHFSHSNEEVTTVQFEGLVTRAHGNPPNEFAVHFRRGGRFLRGKLNRLFKTA